MIDKLRLQDVNVANLKVLMRVDFNVPFDKNQNITDDTRIKAALPSIKYILDNGGALILMSHLGRPKGKKIAELSLKPCAERLEELLQQKVSLAPDCIGESTAQLIDTIQPGEVILLENLRFHLAETKPDGTPSFARQLAQFGDIYVNDAFGTAHRKHSSTYYAAEYFSNKAACGFLMEKEILFLGQTLARPANPFCAIIGGAKVSSKISVIESLIPKVDSIIIGGGMAYTFYKAQGINIGNSLCEDDFIEQAKKTMALCKQHNVELLLPIDNIVADSFTNEAQTLTINSQDGIPEGFEGMDIGPKTIKLFLSKLQNAKTILWNGPFGVFEFPNFAKGTKTIAQGLAKLTNTITIVGGGDSVAAIKSSGLSEKFSHLSTGGGASLEYIEYGHLPGIDILSKANNNCNNNNFML
jgi:phosphoglycerate kinase